MRLVGRWWNGRWGRLNRRDIWLYQDQQDTGPSGRFIHTGPQAKRSRFPQTPPTVCPGLVRNREVDTVAQLRAVIAWARANPHVARYSFQPVSHLSGERATQCRRGHQLPARHDPRRQQTWLICGD